MSLGKNGGRRVDQLREALAFQRWFLRRIRPADDPWAAWRAFEAFALEIQRAAESPFTPMVRVGARDREIAHDELANGHGDPAATVRALAADPWCREPLMPAA
jgi:hypothetical protein